MIPTIMTFYESLERKNLKKLKDKKQEKEIEEEIERIKNEFKELADRIKESNLLNSKNLVGFVRTRNYILEFYPKIWRDLNDEKEIKNIVELFRYAFLNEKLFRESLPIKKLEKSKSLYQLFIKLYIYSLERAIKEGFYFEYTERLEESSYLKGRIDLKKQINKLDKSKFSIDYYEYDVNNILNQNFKYANHYLLSDAEDLDLKRNLISIINQFPDEISKTLSWHDKEIIFSKINDRFEIPYNYANNFVRGRSTFRELGNKKTLWFLFDMNKVFENFVANFLIKNKNRIFENPSEVKIIVQEGERNFMFKDEEPSRIKGLRITRPDIIIEYSNNKIIIDTKYKVINKKNSKNEEYMENNEEDENLDDEKSISNSDLYQIFTYSQIYGSKINILLYPSKDETFFKGPYYFLYKFKDIRFYYGFINLNFTKENWENNMIYDLRNFLQKIIIIN